MVVRLWRRRRPASCQCLSMPVLATCNLQLANGRLIVLQLLRLLGARRQNLSRLRVEKPAGCVTRSWPCLVTGLRVGRQVGPAINLEASTGMPASVSSRPDLTDS